VGEEAKRLFKDANDMLDKLSAEKTLNPRGVVGLFPANRVGDDIEIYRDETRTHVINVSHHLRQQTEKVGFANYCLSDFVAPKLSGKADYIGAFAVTGGLEEDALADAFEAQHDDYNKIMVKAIADRLAEAFAEYLHERVRKVYWGYAANENLSNEELIRENYQGFARHRAIRRVRNTPKSHHLGTAGRGGAYRDEAHRILRHVAVRRFPAGISVIRTASTTLWRKSSAIRLKIMPSVKG
jgi:5-methyltetrahydrofolate--homocysteine methyltransferase